MSIRVSEIVEGSQVRQTKDGYWRHRRLLAEGLDPTNPFPLLIGGTYDQIDATGNIVGTIKVPEWSDPDPYIIGAACLEVVQLPFARNARDKVYVEADYGPADLVNGWKITVTGSGGYRQLSVDVHGNPLFPVKYPAPPGAGTASNGSGGSSSNSSSGNYVFYGAPQYLAPGSVVTFERDVYTSPWTLGKAIKSATNSTAFIGYAAGFVLCRDLIQESYCGATRWHERYVFEVSADPLGWSQLIQWQDRYTGEVPSDVSGTDGSHGQLIADPYQVAVGRYDFNTLGLPTGLL